MKYSKIALKNIMEVKNNKIYLFGGYNGSATNICDCFDLQTKDWKSIHSLP